jgi:hypothetical protein
MQLIDRYRRQIHGVLSCFDRFVVQGTLTDIAYAEAATAYLKRRRVRVFDFEETFAKPLKEGLCALAEQLAERNGLEIEYVRKKDFRKEDRVRKILDERGDHPGLVHVFSAVESCPAYRPWYDKGTGRTYLRQREAKCLHYYFYFVHEELGLCFLRVPTWAPFRLMFYFNAHQYLARQLERRGIGFVMQDNAFFAVDDFEKAQEIADSLSPKKLHRILEQVAAEYCPFLARFFSGYHWSILQAEYATDVIFRRAEDLAPLYDHLMRSAIHGLKADDVAMFLGRKLSELYQGEVGGDIHLRIEGRRVRHHMGAASIKMYDKRGLVLRVETTVNDVTFFKHYRQVEHRDGTSEMKTAPMKKTIYSLPPLRQVMSAANRRYLDYLSTLDDPSAGQKTLDRISQPVRENDRPYRGFNLFDASDLNLFRTLARGGFTVSGFRNLDLRKTLGATGPQVSRLLKRLRVHGLVKKVRATYKYYLTSMGRAVVLSALLFRELVAIPLVSASRLAMLPHKSLPICA